MRQESRVGKQRWNSRARMFGWWYVCLGIGFALLGARGVMRADAVWANLLRFAIAVGFVVLGWITLRGAGPSRTGKNPPPPN